MSKTSDRRRAGLAGLLLTSLTSMACGGGEAVAAPPDQETTPTVQTAQTAQAAQPTRTAKSRPPVTAARSSAAAREAMVTLTAGCVTVGPAKPYHVIVPRQVCLPAFRLDRAEVTVAQYRQCVAAGLCKPAPADGKLCNANRKGREQHPANCVAYADAAAYCKWRGGRLPRPDEWERAARGPAMTTYPWGEAAPTPALAVNGILAMRAGGGHDHDATTAPVCSRPKGNSPEGLCDLAGNVAEWVAGYWADSALLPSVEGEALGPLPAGMATDGGRMTRGGSFAAGLDNLRGWARQRVPADEGPSMRDGLRCAADAP